MTGAPRCREFKLRWLRQRVNSSVVPEVSEPLQEIDRVSPRFLVVAVDRIRKALFARVILVMARLLFQVLPGRLLRVLLRRVLREADDTHLRVPLEPLLDPRVSQVQGRVEPKQDRAARGRLEQHLEPAYGRLSVLEVDRKRRHLLIAIARARPQSSRPCIPALVPFLHAILAVTLARV